MPNIVVVEDDVPTSDQHRKLLETLPGTQVRQAYTYEEADHLIRNGTIDLLVVDIELGGPVKGRLQGLDLLRDFGKDVTTIIVTGMPEENLRTIALKLKAYDFIRKPINEPEFLNKVGNALAFGSVTVEREEQESQWPSSLSSDMDRPPNVLWKSEPVNLTLTELTIVHCLAQRAGETVPYARLSAAMKTGDSPRALATHVAGVRKKFLEVDASFNRIETDPGRGYRWKADA